MSKMDSKFAFATERERRNFIAFPVLLWLPQPVLLGLLLLALSCSRSLPFSLFSVARFDWIYCLGFLAFARALSRFRLGSLALSLQLSRAFTPALALFRSGSLAARSLLLGLSCALAIYLYLLCSGLLTVPLGALLLCSGTRSMAVGQCSSFLFPVSSLSMRYMVLGPSLSLHGIFA